MVRDVSVAELRAALYGTGELALLDVREPGQTGEGHILFSTPLPYSWFETGLPVLVPNPAAPMVLCDDGDGVAARAARRAEAMGYGDVAVLAGGVPAWAAAGHVLYRGVNVPSKVFGELVEEAAHTPRLAAEDVARRQAEGAPMVIVDGRPLEEYAKMNIPGAVCCANGELALRIDALVGDPDTPVVVNCAGRTRSIIGAQTLIDLGLPNPVYALENGTQGWQLAGLELEHGRQGVLADPAPSPERQAGAQALAAAHDVTRLDGAALAAWLSDADRTVYLLDVRSADERAADDADTKALLAAHRVVHAPGGQLVQATDQWVGVRRARLVVLDTEDLRAPVVAAWLTRLGHHAAVVAGGIAALAGCAPRATFADVALDPLPEVAAAQASQAIADGARVIDLRASAAYREGHIPGAVWSIRPRIASAVGTGPHILMADTPDAAALAAEDLREAGVTDIAFLSGGLDAWQAAGHPVEASPQTPPDGERIDYLFFVHDRHTGNLDAARGYLAWETGLIAQLDPDERAVFRI